MATYITLATFTDQGIRNIKDTADRFEAFKALAEGKGITVKSAHWTMGAYDIVLISEGPEEAMMSLTMKAGSLGNVRTQTLRGFTLAEVRNLVASLG